MELPSHAWLYLRKMCERERERLSDIACQPGNILPMMSSWDSLSEIEYIIPQEHWATHERYHD